MKDQPNWDVNLAEDLKIYFSQNEKEPSKLDSDKQVELYQLHQMNIEKKRTILFGQEFNRQEKKYPDFVYVSFQTMNSPVCVYL